MKEYDIDSILVENKRYSSSRLRTRLLSLELLQNKCYECGIGPKWNGKELVLQIDHINGIHSDNRIENLRILCPNCHTQTDTFGVKNRNFEKPLYKCMYCDSQRDKTSKSKLCNKCFSKSRRKVLNRPEKEILKKQISELGYCGTGRLYGVSDNAIRKWEYLSGID